MSSNCGGVPGQPGLPGHARVLDGDQAAGFSPMVWRQAPVGPGPAAQAQPKPVNLPAPAPVVPIEELERQWQNRAREAHQAGFREGETAGRQRAAAEIEPVISRMSQAIAELAQMRAHLRKEAEVDTIKLAMAIARRVLRREIAVDPEALQGILRAALERLKSQEISRVRVHPSQLAVVRAYLEKAVSGPAVDVVADASRQPGDAIFETPRGNLDASVESHLQEIERGLADRLKHLAGRPDALGHRGPE